MEMDSARLSVECFHESIADPDVFCGGGSVAAITVAGAAATALLVMRLDLKRRANREQIGAIDASAQRTREIIATLHALADADIAALDVLLDAQRAVKEGAVGAEDRYLDALAGAARSPLAIGDVAVELLLMIERELERAARFTVSDLGAAAALIEGACRAAFLTVEVNLALLRDADGSDPAATEAIDARRATLLRAVIELTASIESTTRRRIHQSSGSVA